MNIIKRLVDMGAATQRDPVDSKHIRFANSVAVFVCLFIIANAALSVYYHQSFLEVVYALHFLVIAMVIFFNSRGKRVFAAAWFSSGAIVFVTFYSIVFRLESYNFVFLSMIIFLQFFLFSASEKLLIIIFTGITILCFAGAVLWQEMNLPPLLAVPAGLLHAQKMNSLAGIPFLSIIFGVYAFSTIHKAERDVALEKEKTERLLLNILPGPVAERFKNDQSFLAESFSSVTVLFADIVGFTAFSEKTPAEDIVSFLNDVFSRFDKCTEDYGLEKIKTIGDAYMVAGGVPVPMKDHVSCVCRLALELEEVARGLTTPDGQPLSMRIGIHTGAVTAGVIGVKKFIYDLWGDTVNTASRMESHSEAGSIQVTADVYELIKNQFYCKERGTIHVKGKGAMTTYFLTGIRGR
jgi:adenylate cyclase